MKWENGHHRETKKKNADFEGHDVIFFLLSFFSDFFLCNHGLDDPPSDSFYVNFLVTVNAASVRLKADKSD